jgi:hypothetical protein
VAVFGGQSFVSGAGIFDVYLTKFRNLISQPTPCSLSLEGSYFNHTTRKLTIKAQVKAIDSAYYNSLQLHYAITESDIPFDPNYKNLNFVLRKMLPDEYGKNFRVILPGETFVDSVSYILPKTWKTENLQVIAFAQYDLTKKVVVSNSFWLNQIGDANKDKTVDIGDIIFLAKYIFYGGESPECRSCADANSDSQIDVADITYLINYLYWGGEPPKLSNLK